ncbi:hypothetical protein DRW03_27545 [Corallococcus sp. H22C18031201]|nr:hypothetical protein DRW03_27545 [Corallococcus sp. H22C18031201]
MPAHSFVRPVLVSLLLSAGVVLTACEDTPTTETIRPVAFTPTQVKATQGVSAVTSFADQSGGGIFVSSDGTAVRLRLDGSRAPLEAHPANPGPVGTVLAVHRLGPHSALAETSNGLFLAESGWLLAAPWGAPFTSGLRGTAQTADGAVWLAHPQGLYRLQGGVLSELKVNGRSLNDVVSLAAAPTADGTSGLLFLRQQTLAVAVAAGANAYRVMGTDIPLKQGEIVTAVAGLGPGVGTSGEPWVLTTERLLHYLKNGWQSVALSTLPTEVHAAGRFLWAKAGAELLLYDADANTWGTASDVDANTVTFLAVDESGCAWVRLGEDTVALSPSPAPRVTGMNQGMLVVEDGLVVRAVLPPGAAGASVFFQLGDAEVPAPAPDYSLGGMETDGTPKAYSLSALTPGMHTLGVVARFADGSEARRSVPFSYQPLNTVALSWDKDIRPLHESRCAKCHTTGPGRPLNTYALWKENAALITAAVRDQRMPADGPMDPQQISLIQRWAASGAQP